MPTYSLSIEMWNSNNIEINTFNINSIELNNDKRFTKKLKSKWFLYKFVEKLTIIEF